MTSGYVQMLHSWTRLTVENGLNRPPQSITKNDSTLKVTYRTLSGEILDGNKHIKLIRAFVTVRCFHLEQNKGNTN